MMKELDVIAIWHEPQEYGSDTLDFISMLDGSVPLSIDFGNTWDSILSNPDNMLKESYDGTKDIDLYRFLKYDFRYEKDDITKVIEYLANRRNYNVFNIFKY